jgi:hypothetical protein
MPNFISRELLVVRKLEGSLLRWQSKIEKKWKEKNLCCARKVLCVL